MQEIEKIINDINNNNNIYIINGQDKLLLNEYKKKFIQKISIGNNKNYNYFEDDTFIDNLANNINTQSLFSEKRYVIVYLKEYFVKKTDKDDYILNIITKTSKSTILLILVEGEIINKQLINKLKKKGIKVVKLKTPKYKELSDWINKEFLKRGKKVDSGAIKILEYIYNNNLMLLKNEIEKICLYKYSIKKITKNDINEIISKGRVTTENIIFLLVDAISENKKKEALIALKDLINNGEYSLKILLMIARQIRILLMVKDLKKKGKKAEEIAKIINEHPYPVKKCYRQCDFFKEEQLEIMLEKILEINNNIVTGKYNDEKFSLEIGILELF